MGTNSNGQNILENCDFTLNFGYKNIAALVFANSLIRGGQWEDNHSAEQSAGLFVTFSAVEVHDVSFLSTAIEDEAVKNQTLHDSTTFGGFMYISIGAELHVAGSRFINGIAKSGGAIFAVGEANITIESSEFTQNSALNSGGAIFLSNFRGVNITKNSVFRDNIVL